MATSTLVFLPGRSHGQSNLAAYSPWDHKKSDTTEQLSMHTKTKKTVGKSLQDKVKAIASKDPEAGLFLEKSPTAGSRRAFGGNV